MGAPRIYMSAEALHSCRKAAIHGKADSWQKVNSFLPAT